MTDHQDHMPNVIPLSRAARRREEREAAKAAKLDPNPAFRLAEPTEALAHAMHLVAASKQHGGKPGLYAIAAEDQLGNVKQEGLVLVLQGPMADLMLAQLTQVMLAMGVTETWPPQQGLTEQLEGALEELAYARDLEWRIREFLEKQS